MPLFSKESLETLRQRIDIVEVITTHVDLKRSGSSFKGLCPFHDEKTPSFHIQKGDHHYHCFGCGAHGDAIQFLMNHLKMSFSDAVESLAERFQVYLEHVEARDQPKGPSKALMKQALETAARFYHFYLLHTPEGHEALQYLYHRGIDLEFIKSFQVGLAPKSFGIFRKVMEEKSINDDVLQAAGLLAQKSSGGYREFFIDRIAFPIHDPTGAVIGFSARKYKEDTFGGKYINTPETPLFKKSRVLFGLNHCRRRIAKERRVIVVEGQIDALSLIHSGFNFTVAGQGTAFGEGHVQVLMQLGVNQVYLALDSDDAGMEAATKIGNLFQKEGAGVRLVQLPPGNDPDTFLKEKGAESFLKMLENSKDYLDFLVEYHSRAININSPAGKNELVQILAKQIREWKHSLMVHESLRKLAHLTQIPEHMIGVGQDFIPNIHIRKSASVGLHSINPDRILESDFLRWLLEKGKEEGQFIETAQNNITPEDLRDAACRRIYQTYLHNMNNQLPCDLLTLIKEEEDQELISELLQKKINLQRAETDFIETIQKILDRNWMEKREEVKRKIQSGQCSDEEANNLLKEFDALKKAQPKVLVPPHTEKVTHE
ncbi:MAG: DNA primase [Chlamydiae bacterium]|nr:DNA primase [Chlamydiota bacterium]